MLAQASLPYLAKLLKTLRDLYDWINCVALSSNLSILSWKEAHKAQEAKKTYKAQEVHESYEIHMTFPRPLQDTKVVNNS